MPSRWYGVCGGAPQFVGGRAFLSATLSGVLTGEPSSVRAERRCAAAVESSACGAEARQGKDRAGEAKVAPTQGLSAAHAALGNLAHPQRWVSRIQCAVRTTEH